MHACMCVCVCVCMCVCVCVYVCVLLNLNSYSALSPGPHKTVFNFSRGEPGDEPTSTRDTELK